MVKRLTVIALIALIGLLGNAAWARDAPAHPSRHHHARSAGNDDASSRFVCVGSCRMGYAPKVQAILGAAHIWASVGGDLGVCGISVWPRDARRAVRVLRKAAQGHARDIFLIPPEIPKPSHDPKPASTGLEIGKPHEKEKR
jgi:hypothetical protein